MSAGAALLAAPDNPFANPVARLDLPTPPPDANEIHAGARAAIHAAIERSRRERQPSMVVVSGDPGQGKTHQLAWLRYGAETSSGYYFVEIPPLKDAAAPFAHILRYMVQGLLAHRAGASNSFVRLLWECLRRVAVAVLEHARAAGDDLAENRLARAVIGDDRYVDTFGALVVDDPTLGQLLYANGRGLPPLTSLMTDLGKALCRFTDPAVQPAFFDWLRGAELPDDDLALLGIKRSVETEDRSFEVIRGLLSLSTRPIALCFDQLESTGQLLGDAGATALATALMELYQQTPLVIVLMSQTQFWGDYRRKFPQAALDRMEQVHLAMPTPEDAERLVASRLAGVWRAADVQPPYPTYPFAPAFIRGLVGALRPTIRTLFTECRNTLQRMREAGAIVEATAFGARAAPTVAPQLQPTLAAALETKVKGLGGGTFGQPGGREQYLRNGVLRMLGSAAERKQPVAQARVGPIEDPPKPTNGSRQPAIVTLELAAGPKRVALDAHSSDPRGAWRVLERLKKAVDGQRADTAVLLREADAPIGDGARQTQSLIRDLERSGGGVVWIERDVAHRLVGAELLLDAVAAADIAVGERAVTRDEAITFLLEQDLAAATLGPLIRRLGQPAAERSAPPVPPAAAAPPADDLEAGILRLLGAESAVMTAESLARRLGVEGPALAPALAALENSGRIMLGRDKKRDLTVFLVVERGR